MSDGVERGTSEPDDAAGTAPLLRVVSGDPSPEELAALVAVLGALGAPSAAPARRTPEWNAPGRQVRSTHRHGAGAWRASGLPH